MNPRRSSRLLACLLAPLILALAPALPASSQSLAAGLPELAPGVRVKLSEAAGDTLLPRWQRDLMMELARGGAGASIDSTGAAGPARASAPASVGIDGSWTEIVVPARYSHSTIYDPVRDRIVVFGGADRSGYRNDVWALSLSGTPAWLALTPSTGPAPSGRAGHSAIYDPKRDRMLVFGGYNATQPFLGDVWALSLGPGSTWTSLTPIGVPPSARFLHSAIYDPSADRMLVFGGWDGVSHLADVWALTLADPPSWVALTPGGTPPSGRYGHSAIYDAGSGAMVVFGGWDGSAYLSDVWTLPLSGASSWALLSPTGAPPSARELHGAAYDSSRQRMLVFGGTDGSFRNDIWALSLSGSPAWTALTPGGTSPGSRDAMDAVYDPVRDRLVVCGGWDGASELNDSWALALPDPPAWAVVSPGGAPPRARGAPSAIYDPVRDRVLVFGGSNGSFIPLNDAWALTLSGIPAWTALAPTGPPPQGRWFHSAIYDPVRDQMVVFGGSDGSPLADVWALSLSGTPAWSALTPSGAPPSARYGQSAIYDPVQDRMVVFGGAGDTGDLNDVWALSLAGTPAWAALAPTGTPPAARWAHSAIYDPVRDRMVIFGGTGASGYLNDVWTLSLSGTPAWTVLVPAGTPPAARDAQAAIYDPVRDRMVVFGGLAGGFLNDTWALTFGGSPTWQPQFILGGGPAGRYALGAIYDPVRDRLTVMAGYDGKSLRNDVWAVLPPGVAGVEDSLARPLASDLRPPVPNPSRGPTRVSYALAAPGRAEIGVYDVSGRLVRRLVDGERHAGTGTVVWDGNGESGSRLGAGMYFLRLATARTRVTRKVILLR